MPFCETHQHLLALHDYSHPKVMNAKIVADVGVAALIRLHIAQGAPTLISVALFLDAKKSSSKELIFCATYFCILANRRIWNFKSAATLIKISCSSSAATIQLSEER